MRVFELLEGDVIPFPSKRPAPVSTEEPQSTMATGSIPKIDQAKYNAALRKQQGGSQTVNDIARDIVVRNWDKIMTQQPLPDEDRNTLNTILKADHYMKFSRIETRMVSAQQEAGIKHRDIISYSNPNGREAYVHNDPIHNTFRINVNGQSTPYPTRRSRDLALLQMLDPKLFTPEEYEEFMSFLQRDGSHDAEMEFETQTFDPNTEQREYDTQLLARAERIDKYMQSLARANDKRFFLSPNRFRNEDQTDKSWELVIYDQDVELPPNSFNQDEIDAGLHKGTAELLNMNFPNIEAVEQYLEQNADQLKELMTSKYRIDGERVVKI